MMYSGLGLSFIIPILHGILLFGYETQLWRMSLDWMALMATLNLTGGALYAMRVREGRTSIQAAADRTDSGAMVAVSMRYLGCESPNHALSCGLRGNCASVWVIEGF
jgi:hypothetical protein